MNNHLFTLHKNLTERLASASAQPEQEAWWLIEKVTGKKHHQLITMPSFALTQTEVHTLSEYVSERVDRHKPLQYILGSVPFLDLTITVQPPILIPRPETEEWVAWLIHELRHFTNIPLTILDLCTGSGCIALALAKALPRATVVGLDINPQAVELATLNKANASLHNVHYMKSDLFDAVACEQFDLIVSNPPYLANNEWSSLEKSVTSWEDRRALTSGESGYELYERIIAQAPNFLKKDSPLATHRLPRLVLEMAHHQEESLTHKLRHNGFTSITPHCDLSGKRRWMSAHR